MAREDYTLRKVDKLPDNRFWSKWRLRDGSEVETPMTEAEYRALALPGAGAPRNDTGDNRATWLQSVENWQFDTPTKWMEPGDVCDAWPGKVTIATQRGLLHIDAADVTGTLPSITLAKTPVRERRIDLEIAGGVAAITDRVE